MASEGSPSVNHIPPIVIYDPVLAVARYATGTVLTNSTPQHVAVVDGSGDQITSFGGGTQYAVDTALGSTPTGTLGVAIRDDALSALTPIEGDAIGFRVDANGALWVIPSGTTVVSATDLDIRNLVAATDIVTVTGGAGQTADVKITLDSESVAVTNGGLTELAATIFTEDTVLTTPDVLMVGAREDGSGGARALLVHQNSGGLFITGDQDHDAVDTGFPLKIGGYAKAAAPTNVTTDGDRVNAWFLLNGAQAVNLTAAGALIPGDATSGLTVNLGTNNDVSLNAGTNAIGKLLPSDIDVTTNTNHADKYYTNAGAVTDGIIWSPAAGKRWHITTLYINVSAAATVTIEDDLAAGDSARWKGEFAANSGVVLTYSSEHPFSSGEDAADLLVTTTAGNVYIQAVGFEV